MRKIFVVAGTEDGRELAGFLVAKGYDVTASVISSYGRQLLEYYEGLKINDRKMDAAELAEYFETNAIEAVVDASHPYAENISANAMKVCREMKIRYVRYERNEHELTYDKLYHVNEYEAAAAMAAKLGRIIFLTTGSRTLKTFVDRLKDCTIIARVLPTAAILEECERLGLNPRQLVAMLGPFSKELNVAMFRQFRAEVIVTKNSGSVGGIDEKIEAASQLGLPVVMIDRPKIFYDNLTHSFDGVLQYLNSHGYRSRTKGGRAGKKISPRRAQ